MVNKEKVPPDLDEIPCPPCTTTLSRLDEYPPLESGILFSFFPDLSSLEAVRLHVVYSRRCHVLRIRVFIQWTLLQHQ